MTRENEALAHKGGDGEIVTFIVKMPLSLRKTIKMLAAREDITINEFFLRAAQKEVAEVVAKAKG